MILEAIPVVASSVECTSLATAQWTSVEDRAQELCDQMIKENLSQRVHDQFTARLAEIDLVGSSPPDLNAIRAELEEAAREELSREDPLASALSVARGAVRAATINLQRALEESEGRIQARKRART